MPVATVSSRLDYCNSLYCGLVKGNIRKLQLIQHALSRMVTGTSEWTHTTPLRKALHCQSGNGPISNQQFWYTFTLGCLNILPTTSNSTNLLQIFDNLLPQRSTLKNPFSIAEFSDQSFISMAVFRHMDLGCGTLSLMILGWLTPSVLSGAGSRPTFFVRPILPSCS